MEINEHDTIVTKIIYYVEEESYYLELKDTKYNSIWEVRTERSPEHLNNNVENMFHGGCFPTEIRVKRFEDL